MEEHGTAPLVTAEADSSPQQPMGRAYLKQLLEVVDMVLNHESRLFREEERAVLESFCGLHEAAQVCSQLSILTRCGSLLFDGSASMRG